MEEIAEIHTRQYDFKNKIILKNGVKTQQETSTAIHRKTKPRTMHSKRNFISLIEKTHRDTDTFPSAAGNKD